MTVTVVQSTLIVAGDFRKYEDAAKMLDSLGIQNFKQIEVTYNPVCDLSHIKLERPKYYTRGE